MSKGRKKLGAAEAKAIFREYYDSTLVAPSPEQVMLEAMPFDERVNYIKTRGEEAGLIFPDVLGELKQRLLTTDPLILLAALVFNLVTSSGGEEQQWEWEDSLHKYHVELLQGLILQHDRSDFSSRKDAVEEAVNINFIADGIKLVAKLFPARSDATLDASLGEKERGERRLSEEMRIQTQAVRNWGTLPQVMRITTRLFAPLEERISKATGVRIAGLLMMYQRLTPLVDQRIISHSDGLNSIFAADTLDDAIRRFGAAFPDLKTDAGEFSRYAASVSYNLNAFKQILVAKAGGALPDLFTFTLRDFVDAYPGVVEPEALRRILDGSWASSFGDLRGVPVEDIFLENPVWEFPLVRTGEDIYFCPALWLFVSFCVELMEKVVKINPKLHNKYESKYKGDFLELETERLFREAFPSAKINCGSMGHVKTHGEELENDLIAVLDSCALVVEAKAHKVTPPGRRGRPDRLKTKIKELIVNPSRQGANFVNYLERHPGVTRFASKRGGVNEIDSSPISKYVRLNVTLESLGTLSTFTPKLRAAGLVDAGADIAPTLSLSDLETVFEILEGACEKVHYFMRRAQADHSEKYVGDEMDMLYAYLATGLNFERQRKRLKMQDEDYLLLLMNSRHLNPYLLRHMSKHPVPKPRRLLTGWWREIIRHLEKEKPPRWVEAGCLLLNADIEDQVDFEASFNFLSKEVRKARRARNVLKLRQGIVRTFGDAGGRDAAVAFAYKKLAPEQLDMMRRKAMQIALDHTGSGRAVIIGVDVDRDDVPFSHLDYLSRDR